ncbi:MAG: methyltransferase [Patescibacteria group bacterium]
MELVRSEQLNYRDYLEGTQMLLDQSQEESGPYTTEVLGRSFVVLPNVFSPKYFNDTEIFAKHLPVRPGEEMLEIGPGTGAISINAILNGSSKVVAVDINPSAVENTRLNIQRFGLIDKIDARQGDLYAPIRQDEKFDTIFWNTPFGYIDEENISSIQRSVFDPKYRSTRKFIEEAHLHLKPNGRLLIGFSSTLGKLDTLQEIVSGAGFEMGLIYKEQSSEIHPVSFEIFEAKYKNHE